MIKHVVVGLVAAVVTYYCLPSSDPFNPEVIKGRKVLVTGASSGIGEHIAYHYARLGASVVVTARREQHLKQVVAKCKELGHKDAFFSYIAADMSIMDKTGPLIQGAVSLLGGLDHLVLNHAWISGVDYWRGSRDNLTMLHRRMDINFFSFVHLASHALPHLQKSDNAALTVVSSTGGRLQTPFMIAYSSSKFALDGFFSGLRKELKSVKSHVTTTLCFLGMINTEVGSEAQSKIIHMMNMDFDIIKSWMPPATAEDTAYAVVRSTALGEPELNYPPEQRLGLLVIIRHIWPELLDYRAAMFQRQASSS